MKFLSLDSPLMRFLDKAADLMLLSLLTTVFSVPLVTLGPAVTALYRVLMSRAEGMESGVVSAYFRAFRQNGKQALLAQLALLPMAAAAMWPVYLLYTGAVGTSILLAVLCLIPAALLLLALPYVFALIARFENTLGQTLKNAFVMSIGSLPISLLVTVFNLAPLLLLLFNRPLFRKSLILWPLIGFGVLGWCTEQLLRRVFQRYIPQENAE